MDIVIVLIIMLWALCVADIISLYIHRRFLRWWQKEQDRMDDEHQEAMVKFIRDFRGLVNLKSDK